MRIVVDGMAVDEGGVRTYAENLLAAWGTCFPQDALTVLVDEQAAHLPGDDLVAVRIPRPAVAGRLLVQTHEVRRAVRAADADAVLSVVTSTTLRSPGVPVVVTVHDLRNRVHPEEFTRGRRLVRRLAYGRSFRMADGIVCVSERSRADLLRYHPSTSAVPTPVAPLGADHVLAWPSPTRGDHALAFGHHTNKNAELAIVAWAAARGRGLDVPPLVVVGAGARREALTALAASHGLGRFVEVAPYLPEPDFRACFAAARLVLLPSSFEGFGLPIVEGMMLRKPVVIGPEIGCLATAGGHAVVMDAWTPDALATAAKRALSLDEDAIAAAREHAAGFTWRACAGVVRETLEAIVSASTTPR